MDYNWLKKKRLLENSKKKDKIVYQNQNSHLDLDIHLVIQWQEVFKEVRKEDMINTSDS